MPRQDQPKEIEYFEEGVVRATIWESPSGMNRGLTVTVGRRVWDPQLAEWWTSGNLRLDDLFSAAVALAKAQERIVELCAREPAQTCSMLFSPAMPAASRPAVKTQPPSPAVSARKRGTSH